MEVADQQDNYGFQAELHVANAVHFKRRGLGMADAVSSLQAGLDLRIFVTRQIVRKAHFWKFVAQNVSIVKHHCRRFDLGNSRERSIQAQLCQFPFALASKLPQKPITGTNGSTIDDADFACSQFRDEPAYMGFTEWIV